MLRLIAPGAELVAADALLRAPRACFDGVLAASRSDTYFTRPDDARALRAKVYALADVPAHRTPCAPRAQSRFEL